MKIMMERKIVMVLNMVLLIKYLIFFYLLVLMVPIKIQGKKIVIKTRPFPSRQYTFKDLHPYSLQGAIYDI